MQLAIELNMILIFFCLIKRREQGWTIGWAKGEHCRCCAILTRTATCRGIHSPPTPWAKESATATAHGDTERWGGHEKGAYHWTHGVYASKQANIFFLFAAPTANIFFCLRLPANTFFYFHTIFFSDYSLRKQFIQNFPNPLPPPPTPSKNNGLSLIVGQFHKTYRPT